MGFDDGNDGASDVATSVQGELLESDDQDSDEEDMNEMELDFFYRKDRSGFKIRPAKIMAEHMLKSKNLHTRTMLKDLRSIVEETLQTRLAGNTRGLLLIGQHGNRRPDLEAVCVFDKRDSVVYIHHLYCRNPAVAPVFAVVLRLSWAKRGLIIPQNVCQQCEALSTALMSPTLFEDVLSEEGRKAFSRDCVLYNPELERYVTVCK